MAHGQTFDSGSDLSIDDLDELLRRQESRAFKKRRLSYDEREEQFSGSGSESGEEDFEELETEGVDGIGDEEYSNQRTKYEVKEEEKPPSVRNFESSRLETSLVKFPVRKTGSDTRILKPKPPSIPSATFASLGVSKPLISSLSKMSIRAPTEVQIACIPPLLAGRDCVGNAKTGSGKTIAFALPILQKLSVDPYGIFALVLTPTRELAFQIADQFAVLGAPLSIQTAVIVGGMDMIAQGRELSNRPHVVVATPGRIVDHLKSSQGEWDLSRVKFLVLDEADRLLMPTFAPELAYLFDAIPRERQTCLFTATMTPSIESLIAAPPRPGKQVPFVHRMSDVVETVSTLKQNYILVPSHVREPYLYHLLCNPPESIIHLRRAPPDTKKQQSKKPKSSKKLSTGEETEQLQPPPTIIFAARAKTAAYLTNLLKELGIRSTSLHSRLTQRERLTSLGLFRASVVPVLICTDVGARGLDIDDVAMVINWDMPSEPEEYTHRVGRTARRGREGIAVSFVTERDEDKVHKIEGRIRVKLQEMSLSEENVLEKLNMVSTAKRVANMELHDSDFGKREEIHKTKQAKRQRLEKLRE